MTSGRGHGGGRAPLGGDDEQRRLLDLGRRRARRRLTYWDGLRMRRPNSPPPGRHNAEAGSSLAAARRRGRGQAAARGPSAARGPTLHAVPPHENDSDKSFSSLESASTDDGEELARILDPDELETRVLSKYLCTKRRDEKRRRLSDLGRGRARRRLTKWGGLRVRMPNSPPPGRHNAQAGSSLAEIGRASCRERV